MESRQSREIKQSKGRVYNYYNFNNIHMSDTRYVTLKSHYNEDQSIIEVGVDEAGRGSLAGPVTVAACIMPVNFSHPLVKDSKLLSEKQKEEAYKIVMANAIAWYCVHVDAKLIEEQNILKATLHGMMLALSGVEETTDFDFILVDGDQFHGYNGKNYVTIVGGDNKYTSIAAASIIAKIKHDNWMRECEEGKIYGWASNKGYGTKQHLDAIKEHGPSEHHRTSFISHIVTKTVELF
jgi:ribonuclease HII